MKIDDKYKWLARNLSGTLVAFEEKPIRVFAVWSARNKKYIEETDSTYSFIKWEDDEPYEIPRNKKAIQTVKEYIDSKVEQTKRLDVINKPSHYIGINGLEVEEVTQNFLPRYTDGYVSHRVGSAIEYLLRAPLKNGLEDIEKAKENLQQIIDYENGKSKPLEFDGNESDISTYYGGTNLGD